MTGWKEQRLQNFYLIPYRLLCHFEQG